MSEYEAKVMEFMRSQDESEFELGDTLDVKSSIALIVIIFLAGQSAEFLQKSPPLSPFWHIVQVVSVVATVIAGVLCLIELRPRKYKAPMPPGDFLGWANDIERFYTEKAADPQGSALEYMSQTEREKIKTRFSINSEINREKANLIEWAFYFTAGALLLNLATLVALWA
jgi:hypothetical protein